MDRNFQKKKRKIQKDLRDDGKKHVLWLHDLPEDPESQHLKRKESRDRFAAFVFVSKYQQRRYERHFGIEFPNSIVLRNAIVPFKHNDVQKSRGPIRLIYHTTPHRGLSILIPVFQELYVVFSNVGENFNHIPQILRISLYHSRVLEYFNHFSQTVYLSNSTNIMKTQLEHQHQHRY